MGAIRPHYGQITSLGGVRRVCFFFQRKQRSNIFIDACDSSITIKLGRLLFHVKSVDCRVNSLLRSETPEWLKDSFTWGVREDKSNSIDRRSIVVNHRNCHSHLRHYHRTLSASNGADRLVDFEHCILPNSIFGREFNQARQDSRHYAYSASWHPQSSTFLMFNDTTHEWNFKISCTLNWIC